MTPVWIHTDHDPMDLPTGLDFPAGLTTRALTPQDARAVFGLVVASETHDLGEATVDLEDIVGDWRRPTFRLGEQAVGVESDGELVAYAEVYAGRYADAHVPPEHRGKGIGTALARWTQEEARRQGGTLVGMPVPRDSVGDRLLTHLGYHVRWTSWILEMPGGRSIAAQPVPAGYAIRDLRVGQEHPAYRILEDAFDEWPERTPTSYEDWAAGVVRRPGFEPWQLRLMEDPDGVVVGVSFVILLRDCGYVERLAVRADHRGLGLARALLVDAFELARSRGATRSELSTDSRTGALGLYERVGMRITSTWVHRAIDL